MERFHEPDFELISKQGTVLKNFGSANKTNLKRLHSAGYSVAPSDVVIQYFAQYLDDRDATLGALSSSACLYQEIDGVVFLSLGPGYDFKSQKSNGRFHFDPNGLREVSLKPSRMVDLNLEELVKSNNAYFSEEGTFYLYCNKDSIRKESPRVKRLLSAVYDLPIADVEKHTKQYCGSPVVSITMLTPERARELARKNRGLFASVVAFDGSESIKLGTMQYLSDRTANKILIGQKRLGD